MRASDRSDRMQIRVQHAKNLRCGLLAGNCIRSSQPASQLLPTREWPPPQLDGGWPLPPAAAPDPELRTIVGDGNQAATAAVPGAGAPFFAVLGLVPGRYILKMGGRTVANYPGGILS